MLNESRFTANVIAVCRVIDDDDAERKERISGPLIFCRFVGGEVTVDGESDDAAAAAAGSDCVAARFVDCEEMLVMSSALSAVFHFARSDATMRSVASACLCRCRISTHTTSGNVCTAGEEIHLQDG